MPEAKVCYLCSARNEPGAVRCMQCGERFSGTGLLLEQETEQRPSWWKSSTEAGGSVPIPPQVREQQIRAERRAQEEARLVEEKRRAAQVAQDRLEAARRALAAQKEALRAQAAEAAARKAAQKQTAQTTVSNCTQCGSELGAAGLDFSFCLRCGADVPTTSAKSGTAANTGTGQRVSVSAQTGTVGQSFSGTHTTQQTSLGSQQVQQKQVQHGTVSPAAAAFMSFLMPGVGQLMNGQGPKGVLLLLAMVVAMIVLNSTLGVAVLVGRVLAAIDAYRIAERRRMGQLVRESEWDLG
ncbi:MAG: hypothetical protein OHK0029_06570 [Armatimonadaceae bacterium]